KKLFNPVRTELVEVYELNSKRIIMKKIIIILSTYLHFIHPTPTMEMAHTYQKNEQFPEAIVCYEEIIKNDSLELNAYFNMGSCHLTIGNKEQAIAAFSHILEVNPYAIPAQYNLGYTYKTFGDLDTAIEIYKGIIEISPDYDPAHLALGFAYITKGDFENGWKQHNRYLRQSGKNGDKLRTLLESDSVAYKTILLRPEG